MLEIFTHADESRWSIAIIRVCLCVCVCAPLSSTWPHLNSDVGLEEGEY